MSVIILNSKYVNSFIVFEKKHLKHILHVIYHISQTLARYPHITLNIMLHIYILYSWVGVWRCSAFVTRYGISSVIQHFKFKSEGKEKVTAQNTWYISVRARLEHNLKRIEYYTHTNTHQQQSQPVKPRMSRLVLYGLCFAIFCLPFCSLVSAIYRHSHTISSFVSFL